MEMPRIKPRAAGCEEQTLPLRYVTPLPFGTLVLSMGRTCSLLLLNLLNLLGIPVGESGGSSIRGFDVEFLRIDVIVEKKSTAEVKKYKFFEISLLANIFAVHSTPAVV